MCHPGISPLDAALAPVHVCSDALPSLTDRLAQARINNENLARDVAALSVRTTDVEDRSSAMGVAPRPAPLPPAHPSPPPSPPPPQTTSALSTPPMLDDNSTPTPVAHRNTLHHNFINTTALNAGSRRQQEQNKAEMTKNFGEKVWNVMMAGQRGKVPNVEDDGDPECIVHLDLCTLNKDAPEDRKETLIAAGEVPPPTHVAPCSTHTPH